MPFELGFPTRVVKKEKDPSFELSFFLEICPSFYAKKGIKIPSGVSFPSLGVWFMPMAQNQNFLSNFHLRFPSIPRSGVFSKIL